MEIEMIKVSDNIELPKDYILEHLHELSYKLKWVRMPMCIDPRYLKNEIMEVMYEKLDSITHMNFDKSKLKYGYDATYTTPFGHIIGCYAEYNGLYIYYGYFQK